MTYSGDLITGGGGEADGGGVNGPVDWTLE